MFDLSYESNMLALSFFLIHFLITTLVMLFISTIKYLISNLALPSDEVVQSNIKLNLLANGIFSLVLYGLTEYIDSFRLILMLCVICGLVGDKIVLYILKADIVELIELAKDLFGFGPDGNVTINFGRRKDDIKDIEKDVEKKPPDDTQTPLVDTIEPEAKLTADSATNNSDPNNITDRNNGNTS